MTESSPSFRLVDDDRPLVAMVHGLAGAGKSTLLRALAARARGQGAVVVQLDGAEIEPTRRGFLAALASVIGGPCRRRRRPPVAWRPRVRARCWSSTRSSAYVCSTTGSGDRWSLRYRPTSASSWPGGIR